MTTPDFEEWLRQQDFDVTKTADIETFQTYLADEFGIHGESIAIAGEIWNERFNVFEPLGIRSFDWHTYIHGVLYKQTRYAIEGVPGAWGRESALLFGSAIAREFGLFGQAETLSGWYGEEYG